MARTPQQERLRYARIDGASTAIDDLRRLHPDLAAASREHWPELWERIDKLLNIIRE